MKHDPRLYFHILALELADPPVWEHEARRPRVERPSPVDVAEVIRRSEIKINPDHATILENYKPVKEVGGKTRSARFDKVDVYERNGVTYGYYSVIHRDYQAGVSERHCWRYRVENGVPVEDHAFPVSSRPM